MWPFNRKKKERDVLKEAENIAQKAQNPVCPKCRSRETNQVFEWAEHAKQYTTTEVFKGQQVNTYRCTRCDTRFYA